METISQSQPAVEIKQASFSYNGRPVLSDVSLTIAEHDFSWIVGPNGGGKTTLLKLMLGLLQPSTGTVRLLGASPRRGRRQVGYMPQHMRHDNQFPVDVVDVVLLGRIENRSPLGFFRRHDRELALEALREVGMVDRARTRFSELSGGEQRRVLIARALSGKPRLLLLDEPTANLDLRVEEELFDLLQHLNQRLTIVMVSHDPAFVSPFVKSVICVKEHVHVHPTAEIDAAIMSELYGRPIRMIRHDRHYPKAGDA